MKSEASYKFCLVGPKCSLTVMINITVYLKTETRFSTRNVFLVA